MKKERTKERVPRMQGLTYLCQKYHTLQNKEEKEIIKNQIQRRYIDDWISTGGYDLITNQMIPIHTLANRLDMTEEEVQERLIGRIGHFSDVFDATNRTQLGHIASGAIFRSLFLGLESRAIAMSQAQLLIGAQKGKYVPFLSKEANGAISNLIGANKTITDVAKLLSDLASKGMAPTTPIDDEVAYLTPTEAVRLLGDKGLTMIEDTNLIQNKKAALKELPDINPMTQKADLPPIKEALDALPKEPIRPSKPMEYGHEDILEAEEFIG